MKIITNDYNCGISSAILDYDDFDRSNVILVSQNKFKHVFDLVDEDLLFVGHDFLHYLWATEKQVEHWKNYRGKKHIWCFEKIDSIVPHWRQKSHYNIARCHKFTNSFFASDEQDCRKYNIKWLPQWGSKKFYDLRSREPTEKRIVFSGQAKSLGYKDRTDLMNKLMEDPDIKDKFYIKNTDRVLSWSEYVDSFLSHKIILAPIGNFKGCNTRTFEALTSGRVLLQQVDEHYEWHINMLSKYKNVVTYTGFDDLKNKIINSNLEKLFEAEPTAQFHENNLHSRMKLVFDR